MSNTLDKEEAQKRLEDLRAEVEKQERLLKKLENAPVDVFKIEPGKGSVIRFTRKIGSSDTDYSFVAVRTGSGWYVGGRKVTLQNMLHLSDGPNTWEDLVLAMSGATLIEMVESWDTLLNKSSTFDYFEGVYSYNLYRYSKESDTLERFVSASTGWVHVQHGLQRAGVDMLSRSYSYARLQWPEAF